MNNDEFYRVIKIIDDMNIVINCGSDSFVEKGSLFQIYSKKSETVIDPYTNEPLGELRMVKATVQVTAIFKKMCICQNAQTILGTSGSAVSAVFNKRTSLNIDPSQISGSLSGEDKIPIQIGDIAEKI